MFKLTFESGVSLMLLLIALLFLQGVVSLDNGLARTPPMGWLTWQRFRCETDCKIYPRDCISEDLILRQAKELVSSGWKDRGYRYVIIDDCWSSYQRNPATHKLVADPIRFPHGIKWLADQIHSMDLLFGIYLDFGTRTCAGYPGSLDYLELDAQTMAEWEVDYIKMDGCWSKVSIQPDGFAMFGRYLNATKRPMVFGCSYPAYSHWYDGEKLNWTQLIDNCNLWRMFEDVQDSFSSVLSIMRQYEAHRRTLIPAAGPGHWNDLDMLLGGNFGLSWDETRVQMGIWAMHASPLIISVDLEDIKPEMKEILQAPLVIRINQDKLGKPADLVIPVPGIKVWVRQLSDFNGGWALAYLNLNDGAGYPIQVVCSLKELGVKVDGNQGTSFKLIDAFTGSEKLTTDLTTPFEVRVNPSGIVMLIAQPPDPTLNHAIEF